MRVIIITMFYFTKLDEVFNKTQLFVETDSTDIYLVDESIIERMLQYKDSLPIEITIIVDPKRSDVIVDFIV